MTQTASLPRGASYAAEVLRLYTLLPGTPDRPRPSDRRLAAELERQGVPLDLIHAAFILGAARRACSLRALPAIRSLHYFLPILDEVQEQPPDPSYIELLDWRLRAAARSASDE